MQITERVFQTSSAKETQRLGFLLAQELLREEKGQAASVFALQGDLGSGKTTFVQGFAEGLGVAEKILSPTFVIVKQYKIHTRKDETTRRLYHIDCYRAERAQDILDLGWEEIISDPQNIVLIEWPERIQEIVTRYASWITFDSRSVKERAITIRYDKHEENIPSY